MEVTSSNPVDPSLKSELDSFYMDLATLDSTTDMDGPPLAPSPNSTLILPQQPPSSQEAQPKKRKVSIFFIFFCALHLYVTTCFYLYKFINLLTTSSQSLWVGHIRGSRGESFFSVLFEFTQCCLPCVVYQNSIRTRKIMC